MSAQLEAAYKMEELCYDALKRKISSIHYKNEDSYLLSATYYRLTGRKGAWVFSNRDSLIVAIKHPHIDNCIIIFPEISEHPDFSLTTQLLADNHWRGRDILLCRYTSEEIAQLKLKLSQSPSTRKYFLEFVPEEILDWKYPVRILDTKIVSNLEGGSFRKIRNKYLRAGEGIEIITIENKSHLNLMKAALKFWEGSMILNGKETVDMADFYCELFEQIASGMEMVSGLCFMKNGRPVGFTAWDVCSDGMANLFVNLADTTITGSSDFQLISTCRILMSRGISLLNTGGSESFYLDQFKEKYLPVISLNIYTYRVYE